MDALDPYEDDDWDYYYDDEIYCTRCDGEGEIMVCPDDLCRGVRECLAGTRGKGCFVVCPEC